jgi:hypothetical protein
MQQTTKTTKSSKTSKTSGRRRRTRRAETLAGELSDQQVQTFGRRFLGGYLKGGFQSLSKRDIDCLVYFNLELSGAIDPKLDNHSAAQLLRITPQKLRALRKDSYARWSTEDERIEMLRDTLCAYFTPRKLKAVLRDMSSELFEGQVLPILIEHPAERSEFVQAIKELDGVPRYARNREVLLVPLDTLIDVAEYLGLSDDDTTAAAAAKKAFDGDTDLKGLLTTDIRKLNGTKLRSALNKVGGSLLAEAATGGVDLAARGLATWAAVTLGLK